MGLPSQRALLDPVQAGGDAAAKPLPAGFPLPLGFSVRRKAAWDLGVAGTRRTDY